MPYAVLAKKAENARHELRVVCSACESVGTTDPTILPARKVVLALAFDPLDNHEIAFGVARFALHLFSQRCVWRWGSVLPTVARGASCVQLVRSADTPVVSSS